jgi:ubiquinone/menaquinone biosynthesis C-methylase UbiE
MKRTVTTELLDSDSGTSSEVASSLADLRRINRWFGGNTTTRACIERVIQQLQRQKISLLEVAAGSGETPRIVKSQLRERGIEVDVTLLDRMSSHLAHHNVSANGCRAVAGDALALPFRDASFDVVSCNLFAHHLSPEQLVLFANEALRVCRYAVLVNDLVRHRTHLAFVLAGLPLFRSRLTRNDAPASVRQAYTLDEMTTLFAKTSAARVEIQGHYLFRMSVVAWKAKGQPQVYV